MRQSYSHTVIHLVIIILSVYIQVYYESGITSLQTTSYSRHLLCNGVIIILLCTNLFPLLYFFTPLLLFFVKKTYEKPILYIQVPPVVSIAGVDRGAFGGLELQGLPLSLQRGRGGLGEGK